MHGNMRLTLALKTLQASDDNSNNTGCSGRLLMLALQTSILIERTGSGMADETIT